jgi:quercetin dioxygenase-like cupin family protein
VSETGYEVLHIDELEAFTIPNQDGLTWRPIRRRLDIQAFGVNAYTAEQAGQRVVEEHREGSGHQELYIVIAGRATFTLDGEEHDAPAGTLVFVKPGTLRSAFAAEPGTTVIGVGAKPGEVFRPSAWEWSFAAFGYLEGGDAERARAELEKGIAARPDAWQGYYNYACLEARAGDTDAALRMLERAAERDPEQVARIAPGDDDFASLRDDPRFLEAVSQ